MLREAVPFHISHDIIIKKSKDHPSHPLVMLVMSFRFYFRISISTSWEALSKYVHTCVRVTEIEQRGVLHCVCGLPANGHGCGVGLFRVRLAAALSLAITVLANLPPCFLSSSYFPNRSNGKIRKQIDNA